MVQDLVELKLKPNLMHNGYTICVTWYMILGNIGRTYIIYIILYIVFYISLHLD